MKRIKTSNSAKAWNHKSHVNGKRSLKFLSGINWFEENIKKLREKYIN